MHVILILYKQEDPWKFYNFSATKEQKKKLMFKQVAKYAWY